MRPVRLSLEGFTSFKESATLDFGALDLFVIHGATGAGKSSLLDAMTYALFGAIPRAQGRGGVADFISLGRKKAATSLEFVLRDDHYRVTRTAARGKKSLETKALLERRRSADFYQTVAEGVSRVDAALAEMLHMTCDVFTQAVVLPQGQFATFLKSAPRERRQMLNELLQLQVFEKMQRQAGTRKAELETQETSLTRRLEEDFAGVSRANLDRIQAELAATETASALAQKSLAERRAELDDLRSRFSRHQEWAASQETLRGLVAREPEMGQRAESVRLARAARTILPILDEAERDQAAAAALERETTRLAVDFESAQAAYAKVQVEREAADEAAEEVPVLEARRLLLAEIAGKVTLRRTLQENQATLADDIVKKEAKLDAAKKSLTRLEAEEKAGHRDLAKLLDERQPLPADVDDRLERGRSLAARLDADQQELVRQTAERSQIETQRSAAFVAVDEKSGRRRDCDAKLRSAEQVLESAVAERERRRHACLVEELRRDLRAGADCPVCGQTVEHPPKRIGVAAAVDDEVGKFEKRVTKLRGEASRAAAEMLVAEAERDRLTGFAADVAALIERQQGKVAALETELGRVLPTPGANGSVEKAFVAWADSVRQIRERADRIDRDAAVLSEKLANIERSRVPARTSIVEIETEIRDGKQQVEKVRQSLTSVAAEIAAITTHADPRQESEEIARTIEARKSAQARTQKEEAARAGAMESARAERDQHRTERTKAQKRVAESAKRADQSLAAAGFDSAASARAVLRSPADLDALDAELAAFHRDLDAVRRRLLELDVAGPPVDAARVAALDEQVHAEERESQELLKRQVRQQEETDRLKRALLRMEEVENERTTTSRSLTVYRQLADDLRSDRFQAYMLEETLADLVRGASQQLGRLTSDRFGLCFEEDQIRVVDLDNAGEVRSADTLSGGETFLASLALALELSAQVQRSVGAVSLDCLFIDEGFGSLDPDSIGVVADSIRGLQVGGRMVGIITHLPDFIEQFDQRVFVEKCAGVSSLRVETAPA